MHRSKKVDWIGLVHERRFALNRVLEAAVELGSELQGAVTLHWAAVAPVIVVALRRADSVLCWLGPAREEAGGGRGSAKNANVAASLYLGTSHSRGAPVGGHLCADLPRLLQNMVII